MDILVRYSEEQMHFITEKWMRKKQLCFWILRMGMFTYNKKTKTLQETDYGHDRQSIQPIIKQQPQILYTVEPIKNHTDIMSCLSPLKLQHCYEADRKLNQFMSCQYNIVGVQMNAMLCLLSNKQKENKTHWMI